MGIAARKETDGKELLVTRYLVEHREEHAPDVANPHDTTVAATTNSRVLNRTVTCPVCHFLLGAHGHV